MIHTVKAQVVRGITEVRVMYPGPQGANGGTSASDPTDAIYLTCASDDTIHALTIVKDQGYYTLQIDQADSTP